MATKPSVVAGIAIAPGLGYQKYPDNHEKYRENFMCGQFLLIDKEGTNDYPGWCRVEENRCKSRSPRFYGVLV